MVAELAFEIRTTFVLKSLRLNIGGGGVIIVEFQASKIIFLVWGFTSEESK